MTSYQVTCHVPDGADRDQRIDAIGGAEWKHLIDDAIYNIDKRIHDYWTYAAGARTKVIVAERSNGRKYLKTVADGIEPNNLLALPRCS
ncbi:MULTISPECIES: DUF3892 domain-containing protein [Bradyrhizobium]|jgi:Protein of unknown function (DUF3892)|uniref:DUF3892 domain-containing protein n=1 Tax=Bradyrhizobium elkanii TaxID=29448 RepID=A0A8I1Y1L8_BRAEL|nr:MULTISPECIES: DUF3892 domain-containing protein [Bradyrhizobium]MBP1290261.1 hypothetical protein [Bradyrhizobium elkanii]MCP1975581.1 hypothetical protein [Bradyrhizobium elkanii]MCS3482345.1 hypothetical protein [Bradyrhizobium elkanii]MCS3525277.1 hypothetical protein [Bradyrhizobium elkanii]MCS4075820.1 hypothetical protein [Bradyrhizobium elkanii]